MQSTATTVEEYMLTVPPERKPALEKLRAICLETFKGYEEVMAYGMPGYRIEKIPEVSFNSQKNFIALYILKKDVLDKYRDEIKASIGKGCIRYTNVSKMDFTIIEKMLRDSKASNNRIC